MRKSGVSVAIGLSVVMLLAGCMANTPASRGSFKTDYIAARDALETGRYSAAIAGYERLLPQAGPLQGRIRLEYAHALLRDDRFADASDQARILAGTETGTARAAALAVEGTAEHELALAAQRKSPGDTTAIRAHLLSAQSALATALKDPGKLDPLGTLAARKQQVDQMLAQLG